MSFKTDNYWAENIRLIIKLLLIWFSVSFLFGIILVEPLNAIQIGGYKLGFWFSQQGSIMSFVLLIFYYVRRMNQLDHQFEVDD